MRGFITVQPRRLLTLSKPVPRFPISYRLLQGRISCKSTCSDTDGISQILNRKWLLQRPDTRIQPLSVSYDDTVDGRLRLSGNQLHNGHERVMYIIRDDLLHPIMGGNKLRKLDALVPLLLSSAITDVVTCGGCQSAHTAALAVACAENGIQAHLLLRGERLSVPTGYNLISGMYGSVTYVSRSNYADRDTMLRKYAEDIAEDGSIVSVEDIQSKAFSPNLLESSFGGSTRKVAIVKEGAGDAIALLGLIRLVHYLAQPSCFGRDEKLQLVVDSGTGTTAVGLALGILLLRLPWEVVSVMLAGSELYYKNIETRLVDDFNSMWSMSERPGVKREDLGSVVSWVERHQPRRFGNVLEGEIETCRNIAQETGILFDPIYTFAACETGGKLCFSSTKKVAVLHTGGTLALFGLAQRYPGQF